jgi:solute carrier family 35 protein F5
MSAQIQLTQAGQSQRSYQPTDPGELPPLTVHETGKLAFIFCLLWFMANWSVNASLDYTSVASTTILSSLSGRFHATRLQQRVVVNHILRILYINHWPIISSGNSDSWQDWRGDHQVLPSIFLQRVYQTYFQLVTSFAGSILVASSDTRSGPPNSPTPPINNPVNDVPDGHFKSPLLGDSLALLSAIFYAIYVILLKVRIREESRINMQLFFGSVGLINILCCWPMGFILHFIGAERFELPTTRQAVIAIVINVSTFVPLIRS